MSGEPPPPGAPPPPPPPPAVADGPRQQEPGSQGRLGVCLHRDPRDEQPTSRVRVCGVCAPPPRPPSAGWETLLRGIFSPLPRRNGGILEAPVLVGRGGEFLFLFLDTLGPPFPVPQRHHQSQPNTSTEMHCVGKRASYLCVRSSVYSVTLDQSGFYCQQV